MKNYSIWWKLNLSLYQRLRPPEFVSMLTKIMLLLNQMRTALYQEKIALDEKLFYVYFLVKNYFLSHYIVKFKMCGLQTALWLYHLNLHYSRSSFYYRKALSMDPQQCLLKNSSGLSNIIVKEVCRFHT